MEADKCPDLHSEPASRRPSRVALVQRRKGLDPERVLKQDKAMFQFAGRQAGRRTSNQASSAWRKPLTLWRTLCFTPSTDFNVNFIQITCIVTPGIKFDLTSGHPVAQSG